MNSLPPEPSLRTPVAVCFACALIGPLLGMAMNAINAQISRDYFAIVLSWDWAEAPARAIWQGALEGSIAGFFLGVCFAAVTAASTRMRCPLPLAMRMLALIVVISIACWIVGGIVGMILSFVTPRLWGFVFVGVPPRVSLPHFAWVGGSILGAYGGAVLGLIVASIKLHKRWKKTLGPVHGFAVMPVHSL